MLAAGGKHSIGKNWQLSLGPFGEWWVIAAWSFQIFPYMLLLKGSPQHCLSSV